jgi:hypothetical protein
MTYLRLIRKVTRVTPIVLIFAASAMAEWKAANSELATAAKEPKIASSTGGCQRNRCGADKG